MQLTTNWQTISSAGLISNVTETLEGRYTSQSTTDNYTDAEFRIVNYATNSTQWRTSSGAVRFTGEFSDSGSCATYPNYVSNGNVLLTIQKRIYHRVDGTMSINLGGHVDALLGGTRYNSNPAQTEVILPSIARFATMTSATNFNDEQNPSFTFTNPANASMSCWLEPKPNGEHLAERTLSGTSGTYTWTLTDTERNQLRNKCTDSGNCVCRIGLYSTIGGDTSASYIDATMTIVNANPTFSVSYQDTNATTTAITSDNQKIIQNKSTLQVNISSAAASKGATLSTAKVTINGVSTSSSISTSTLDINIGTLNISQNTNAVVRLTDSRGYYTEHTLTLEVLPYETPSAIVTLKRKLNYYTATDIKVDAGYSSLDGENTITINYRIKKTTDLTWGAYSSLTDNVTSTFNADNLFAWDVEILLQDALETRVLTETLGTGQPPLYVDVTKNSIGVNCFPTGSKTIEVDGADISNTYSTNEIVIGKWINNKPIYRKVLELSNPSSQTLADLSSYNIDYMKDIRYTTSRINTQDFNNIYQNTSEFIRIFYKTDNNTLQFRGIDVSTIYNITIILEYTKTTD